MIIPIVLSGGSGSRLWPISKTSKPKQFVNFIGEKTLFSQTLDRVLNKDIFNSPIILGNIKHKNLLIGEMSKYSDVDYTLVLEPEARNTAPAIASTIEFLYRNGSADEIVIFLPSDAYIDDNKIFEEYITEGCTYAKNGKIVCFGVNPTYPETGYGYIKKTSKIGSSTFLVENFLEKPKLDIAKQFLEDGSYLWNAGIFMSKVSTLHYLFNKHSKSIADVICETINNSVLSDDNILLLDCKTFSKAEDISIDYAVMERLNSDELVVVSMDINWSDLGSYKSLHMIDSTKTNENNVIKGKVVLNNTENCYIRSDKKIICCSDVDDLVIVEEDDVILVMKKDKSQNVKNLIKACKEKSMGDIL